jgi:hypothetical protein
LKTIRDPSWDLRDPKWSRPHGSSRSSTG